MSIRLLSRREIPVGGSAEFEASSVDVGTEVFTGSRHDDDFVFAIGADVGKTVAEFFMGESAPHQALALGVKSHGQNAVLPLKFDVLVAVTVLLEARRDRSHSLKYPRANRRSGASSQQSCRLAQKQAVVW
jgi:hypothetical protein